LLLTILFLEHLTNSLKKLTESGLTSAKEKDKENKGKEERITRK